MIKIKNIIATLAIFLSGTVLAQPQTDVGDSSGQPGTNVTVPITYTGTGAGVVAFTVDVQYDNTVLTVANLNCNASLPAAGGENAPLNCVDNGSMISILANPSANLLEISDGEMATVEFTINGAAPTPSTSTLTVANEAYGDSTGTPVAPTGVAADKNGTITIQAGPTPAYTSDPVTTSTLTFATVLQGGTPDTQTVDITNTGDVGTTLSGTCALAGADAGFYTINSGASYSVLQGAAADTVTVQCNTVTAGAHNAASLDCTSTAGGNGTYPLSCTVGTPAPAYTSANPTANSAIVFGSAVAGTGNLTNALTITNTGDAGTTLTTSCSISGADAARFSVAASLSAGIAQGGAGATGDVTCLDGAAAVLSASLDCTHDGSAAGAATPVAYPLSCTYTLPGQAQYASTPADGTPIDMTSSGAVLIGSAAPTASIVISNPAPNSTDLDLGLGNCTYTGDAAISVTSTDPLSGISLAPQSAATETVALSCSTATVGMFTGSYDCPYSTDGVMGAEATASYAVSCDIRAAESAGSPNTGDSPLAASITAPPGGSSLPTSVVTFSELNNEGEGLTGLTCSLATGVDFSLGMVMFPPTILFGAPVAVSVTFTDPGVPGPYTDILTCEYTDSSGLQTIAINLTGSIRAVIVPTLSWVGYVAMMFGLLLVGFFGFRRRA